jgi:hypothetical protein
MTTPLATADPSVRAARRRLSLLLVRLVAPAVSFAHSSAVKERTTTKIADGIYVIRHPDAPNGEPYLDLDGLMRVAYEGIQPR